MLSKYCTGCGREKPRDGFSRRASAPDGLQVRCKECNRRDGDQWRSENPEARRWEALKRSHNMTREEWFEMLVAQEGMCMCGAVPKHVDHDHSCCPGTRSCGNCVRALLCAKCNSLDVLRWGGMFYVLGVPRKDTPREGTNKPRRQRAAA